jgi:hypothetical protein
MGYIVLEELGCLHLQDPEEGIKSKIRMSVNVGRYKHYKQNCSINEAVVRICVMCGCHQVRKVVGLKI